jgi:hypothetical protein
MVSGANGRPKAASRMDIPMLSLGSGAVSGTKRQAQVSRLPLAGGGWGWACPPTLVIPTPDPSRKREGEWAAKPPQLAQKWIVTEPR